LGGWIAAQSGVATARARFFVSFHVAVSAVLIGLRIMEMHAHLPEPVPELLAEPPLQHVSDSGSDLSPIFLEKTDSERPNIALRNTTVGEQNLLPQMAESLSSLSAPDAHCL